MFYTRDCSCTIQCSYISLFYIIRIIMCRETNCNMYVHIIIHLCSLQGMWYIINIHMYGNSLLTILFTLSVLCRAMLRSSKFCIKEKQTAKATGLMCDATVCVFKRCDPSDESLRSHHKTLQTIALCIPKQSRIMSREGARTHKHTQDNNTAIFRAFRSIQV